MIDRQLKIRSPIAAAAVAKRISDPRMTALQATEWATEIYDLVFSTKLAEIARTIANKDDRPRSRLAAMLDEDATM